MFGKKIEFTDRFAHYDHEGNTSWLVTHDEINETNDKIFTLNQKLDLILKELGKEYKAETTEPACLVDSYVLPEGFGHTNYTTCLLNGFKDIEPKKKRKTKKKK